MSLFIPLRKVDAAQRLVYGRIDETPDHSGEVFDYRSSKRYFQSWSQDMAKTTGGKSYGNVRAMHGSIAAGKIEAISFDDKAKRIELAARIVDDAEWQKVEQGVYTGFSPGGRYVKRWKDGQYTRYTAQPTEISIVDLPCIPSASFTMIKVGGVEEEVAFRKDEDGNGNPVGYSEDKLGELMGSLDWLWQSSGWEDQWAIGSQPIPDEVKAWLEEGSSLLQPLVDAEAENDSEPEDDSLKEPDALAAAARTRGLAKMRRSLGMLRKQMDDLSSERDDLKKRLAVLEAMPKPGGPVLKAVGKGDDVAQIRERADLEKIAAIDDNDARSLELIKLAHRHPQVVRF